MKQLNEAIDVAVIGAGISGLHLAYRLLSSGLRVELFDSQLRAGGWIDTVEDDAGFWETGPRGVSTHGDGKAVLALAQDLGLEEQVVWSDPSANTRYYCEDYQLYCMPALKDFLYPRWLGKILKLIYLDLKTAPITQDLSVEDFVSLRMGREFLPWIELLCTGIFAASPKDLSMKSTFTSLFEGQKTYGSLSKYLLKAPKKEFLYSNALLKKCKNHALFNFDRGMRTLILTLESKLKKKLHLDHRLVAVQKREKEYALQMEHAGKPVIFSAKKIVFAGCLQSAWPLLKPMCQGDFSQFEAVRPTGVVLVSFFACEQTLDYKGFGFLWGHDRSPGLLGSVWDSQVFPSLSKISGTRVSCMYKKEFASWRDDELISRAQKDLQAVLGKAYAWQFPKVRRAPQALSSFPPGFLDDVKSIRAQLNPKGIYDCGLQSASRGVSGSVVDSWNLYKELKKIDCF